MRHRQAYGSGGGYGDRGNCSPDNEGDRGDSRPDNGGDRGDSGWDNHPHGLPTIDEAFVNFRSIGGAISMHGPMNAESAKAQYRYADGAFFSGEINMALALNDIGEGDGATESFAQLSLAPLPRDSEC